MEAVCLFFLCNVGIKKAETLTCFVPGQVLEIIILSEDAALGMW